MTGKMLRAALRSLASLLEAGYIEAEDGRARIVPAILAKKHGFRAKTLKRYLDELVAAGLAEKKVENIGGNEYAVYIVDVERSLRLASLLSTGTGKPMPLADAESLAAAITEKLGDKIVEKLATAIAERASKQLVEVAEEALRRAAESLLEELGERRRELEKYRAKARRLEEENRRLRREVQELRKRIEELEEELRRLEEEKKKMERERLAIPVPGSIAGTGSLMLAEKMRLLIERNAELEKMVEELKAKIRVLEREKRELAARLASQRGAQEEAELVA